MLKDKFNRTVELIEISVSDRCQYDCAHCGAREAGSGLFATENIVSFVSVMAKLGLRKARLTCMEPLTRPDIIDLLEGLADITPKLKLSMSTNGKLLAAMALGLQAIGLDRVFVTLPALDPSLFAAITGVDDLAKVLDGIDAAKNTHRLNIVIKTPLIAGVNDHAVAEMVGWAVDNEHDIYLVETGECAAGALMSEEDILSRLNGRFRLTRMKDVSNHNNPWKIEGTRSMVKVVTRLNRRECDRCNRMWLSADGVLRPCFSNSESYDLQSLFQDDPTEMELVEFAAKIPLNKPLGQYHPRVTGRPRQLINT